MRQTVLAVAESLRNARAAPLYVSIAATICLVTGAGVASASAAEIRTAVEAADAQYLAGASVIEVTGLEGAPLDALRCHSLMGIEGVIAAGGVMAWESVRLDAEPEADIRLLTTTPGFVVASWPELQNSAPSSVVAASDLARSGLRAGDTVSVRSPSRQASLLHLDAVPRHVSTLGVDRLLLVTAPPRGTIASCLVLADPAAAVNVTALLRDSFDVPTNARPRLSPSELLADPDRMLQSRLSQYGWIVGAAICGIVLLGRWYARRNEFALYRLLGADEGAIVTMLATEFALICLGPAQLGLLIGIGTGPLPELVGQNVLLDILRFDLLLLTLPAVGILALPRTSLLAALTGR